MNIKTFLTACALTATSAVFASTPETSVFNSFCKPESNFNAKQKDKPSVKVEKISHHTDKASNLAKIVKIEGGATKYMLTTGSEKGSTVKVKILDADGETIFNGEHIIDGSNAIVYSLESPGVYTFVVTDKNGDSQLFMD